MAGKLGIGDLAAMGLGNVGLGPLKVGNVLDTVDFVRKAWTAFGMPSGFTPTLDLEELDKRIADLKAVEQWLTLNMNMLQGTIQALEIQRGTIATLKAFGAPLDSAAPAAQAIVSALSRSVPPDGQPGAAPAATSRVHTNADDEGSAVAAAGRTKRASPPRDKERGATAPATGAAADPGLSPSAWWNLLQSQFNQVAAAALSGVGLSESESAASVQRKAAPAVRGRARRTTDAQTQAGPPKAKAGAGPAARARKA